MKKIILLLIFLCVALAVIGYSSPDLLGISPYVDRTPPLVSIEAIKLKEASGLRINAEDELQDIAQLSLELEQAGKRVPFPLDRFGPVNGRSISISVPLRDIRESLGQGPATVHLSAQDSAYWKNTASTNILIEIDKRAPKLELISLQHRMSAGGAELILFKASDSNLERVGAELDGNFFLAQRLSALFPDQNLASDLYAVLIAAPLGLQSDAFQPKIVALDEAGNSSALTLNMRFDEKPVPTASPEITEQFFQTKIPPLLEEAGASYPDIFGSLPDDPAKQFILINQTYREVLRKKLKDLLLSRSSTYFPKSQLLRPMGGTLKSGFGELRNYHYLGQSAGSSVHEGFDIASIVNDKVLASGPGEVILAEEEFGIYGKAVVIDHGLGLSSLYGHLASLAVQTGEKVEAGQYIGQSGQTGLAGGDHLHFELRVGFVPVTPIEWWDQKWFTDDILGKFNQLIEESAETSSQQ